MPYRRVVSSKLHCLASANEEEQEEQQQQQQQQL